MTPIDPDDRDLLEAFEQLRADDRRRTPDAEAMFARARSEAAASAGRDGVVGSPPSGWTGRARRASRLRWAVPGIGVAMAAAVAALLLVDPADDGADFDRVVEAWGQTGGSWRAPTDELLRMPGDELLRGLPRIGGLPSLSPTALDVPVLADSGRENPS